MIKLPQLVQWLILKPMYDDIIDGMEASPLPGMINLHTHLGMIPFEAYKTIVMIV